MRVRTRARELALQFLFQMDYQGEEFREELESFLDERLEGKTGAEEARAYAIRLVDGVRANTKRINQLIGDAARNWDLERMAGIDRNALRIGVYELIFNNDIPMRVAINEAIELAKRYSTEASGAFVNGILDRIRRDWVVT
jgi:N utilization substance protein B